ncbi:hypothetical protein JCM4814A_67980 [Streptomyces phaeofaciens JCM 4814]|uniref:Uncharacterized protein n=1 Tax=Streptomyces phaeofaciens TaxID=68254 RepID=A0A918H6W4_9ACTN|nr:hypothetical protein [Streptomyces phaeofaciens]GGT40901.1 hypothetical protein GCM10010226_16630 [Streptomyces phaeofaciens]
MEDITTHQPASSGRQRPRTWAAVGLVPAAVLVSLGLAVGGFLMGRASADNGGDDKGAADCAKVKDLAATQKAEADSFYNQEGRDDDWLFGTRTYAYLVKQNPECFAADTRAKAQATLDRLESMG